MNSRVIKLRGCLSLVGLFFLVMTVFSANYNSKDNSTSTDKSYSSAQNWTTSVPPEDISTHDIVIVAKSTLIRTSTTLFKPKTLNVYGTLELYGDFMSNGNVTIHSGGILIVRGNFYHSKSTLSIQGNILVLGNFESENNTSVTNNGNLVVAGESLIQDKSTFSAGSNMVYVLNPAATVDLPGGVTVGGATEFLANESTNPIFNTVIELGALVRDYTWTGSTSTDWTIGSNWTNSKLPNKYSNIVIPVGKTVVVPTNSNVEVNGIKIEGGSLLTLEPGTRFTVHGDITNSGAQVVVKNLVTQPTSFLVYGTISAPVTIRWVYTNGRYWYIGHSVDGVEYSTYDVPTSNSFNLFRYTGSAWSSITSAVGLGGSENALEGYSVKFTEASDVTVDYSGELRSGNYSKPINGWNLIANPYPTYLDLASAGVSFGNAVNTVWTTTNASGSTAYATYNVASGIGAGGGTRYVAPGQSFWVRNYSSSSFSVSNSARVHSTGMLKAATSNNDLLRIAVMGTKTEDETVLAFREVGSESFSSVFDSEKRFATGASDMSVYTLKDNKSLVINILPSGLEGRVVPLMLNVGAQVAGTYTLKATNIFEFMPEFGVYLFDKATGETVDLREKPEYSFVAAVGSGQDRFELSFKSIDKIHLVATALEDNDVQSVLITAIGIGAKAVVKVADPTFNGNVGIELIDAGGKVQLAGIYNNARTMLDVPTRSPFYVVKVTYKGMVKTFKIMTVGSI